MSSYIDLKFINSISSRLSQFKKKNDYLFNFRCPHCGDSQKSKTKARAYLYRVKNDMFFKCHNCGMGQNLANFIKFLDPKIYGNYVLERYKGSATQSTPQPKFDFKPAFEESNLLDDCVKVSTLEDGHPVKEYVKKRLIPEKYYDIIYFVNKFHKFANKVKPNTFKEEYEHPRLIIPFFDITGKLFAFQGRAFGKEQPKYLTIKLQENKQKIFGLERVNLHKRLYVVEGPLDSLFLNNCIAAGGADLQLPAENKDVVFIFDNEPRNKEIIDRMYKLIDKDYMIVIWPEGTKEKDINEMIIKGKTKEDLQKIISDNTYSGLSALTQLNSYKRI